MRLTFLVVLLLATVVYFVLDPSGSEIESSTKFDSPPPVENDVAPASLKAEGQSGGPGQFLRAGLPSNTPDPEKDFDGVSDPVQTGECTLEIKFMDSKDFRPVSGRVQLWRLNAPANERWSNGDQLQVETIARQGLLTIEELPEGQYRLHPLFARKGSSAQAAFTVSGEFTTIDCMVEMPSTQDVAVKIYRLDQSTFLATGEPVETKRLGWSITGRPIDPQWQQRRIEKATGQPLPQTISQKKGSGSKRPWRKQTVNDLGVRFAELAEGDRQSMRTYRFQLRNGSRESMRLNLEHKGRDTQYVALFLSADELQDCLVFPEGQSPQDLRKNFIIDSSSVPFNPDSGQTLDSALQQVEVEIHFLAVGFKGVSFKWKPADGPLPKIQLAPQD